MNTVPTYEEKLAGFDRLLATPTLSIEERMWVEKFKSFLQQGFFHEAWSRLQAQVPGLTDLIFSAVSKARLHARTS
jgi:hypothetical protein